jgi:hypothetical protein
MLQFDSFARREQDEEAYKSDSSRKNKNTPSPVGARLRGATRGAGVRGMNTTEYRISGRLPPDPKSLIKSKISAKACHKSHSADIIR